MKKKIAVSLLLVSSAILVAAASASSTMAPDQSAESCVVNLDHPGDPQVCYDSFSDAIYAVSDGEIDLPPNADGSDLTNADLKQAEQSLTRRRDDGDELDRDGNIVSGALWSDASFLGQSRIFSQGNCRNGRVNNVPGLHARLFNDVASSAKGYSNCDANLFEDDDFGGAKLACEPKCAHLGVLSDEVSSVRFKKEPALNRWIAIACSIAAAASMAAAAASEASPYHGFVQTRVGAQIAIRTAQRDGELYSFKRLAIHSVPVRCEEGPWSFNFVLTFPLNLPLNPENGKFRTIIHIRDKSVLNLRGHIGPRKARGWLDFRGKYGSGTRCKSGRRSWVMRKQSER